MTKTFTFDVPRPGPDQEIGVEVDAELTAEPLPDNSPDPEGEEA